MQIAVIGSGVIGLTTGILLLRAGHQVSIYSRDIPPNVTSSVACAQWLPHETSETGSEPLGYNKLLLQWCRDSWQSFAEIEKTSAVKYGIHWGTNYELFPTEKDIPQYILELADLMPNFEILLNKKFPGDCSCCCKFDTFIIETPIYIPRLFQDFEDAGGRVVIRTFETREEFLSLDETIIFNCTGLGSKVLFQDTFLKGIKGQLLLHEPVDIQFMIGMGDFCLIPRSDALILGSLSEEHYETETPTKENDELLWNTIISWCDSQDGILPFPRQIMSKDKLIKSISGIRPVRSNGVRVGHEIFGNKRIVHNYGHGGGGITLSWGCARYALSLID